MASLLCLLRLRCPRCLVGYRLWLLLVALTASLACASRSAGGMPLLTPAGVRFSLEQPAARAVAVAGTFNGWSPAAHPMAQDATRRWIAIVRLPPGEHLFMYVVDGAWVTPPEAADFADDGFGARNGVVVVPPER